MKRRGMASMTLGAAAAFLLVVEAVTGVCLMTVYSPSATTAWGSVWYIQERMTLGWLVRGLHRFASDALIAVAALFLLQLVLMGAYRFMHRRLWWSALGLLFVAMASALSGYTLPWDQHGYWGTEVRTNILALTPLAGGMLREILIGGRDLGNLTLTRFYALHVAVLPVCAVVLYAVGSPHRTSPCSAPDNGAADDAGGTARRLGQPFLCAVILTGLFAAAIFVHGGSGGKLLTAPTDPSGADYPARPEWFNLFLFQWLKAFNGPWLEVLGAVIVPAAFVAAFVLFPYVERWLPGRPGRFATAAFTVLVGAGIVWLTYAAIRADRNPPDRIVDAVRARQLDGEALTATDQAILRARAHHNKLRRSRAVAQRAIELATANGIPPAGPLPLLRQDPMIRGPELFAANCATCHRYDGHNGVEEVPGEPATSSDLAGFASRAWVRGLLGDPMSDSYFGRMTKDDGSPAHTQMRDWIAKRTAEYRSDGAIEELRTSLDAVAAYLENESVAPGRLRDVSPYSIDDPPAIVVELERTEAGQQILDGRQFFMLVCNECHRYDGVSAGFVDAPEMLGYGSVEWLERMIAEPDHELRYGAGGDEPAQTPRFRDRLSDNERKLIATWLHAARTDIPGRDGSSGPPGDAGG